MRDENWASLTLSAFIGSSSKDIEVSVVSASPIASKSHTLTASLKNYMNHNYGTNVYFLFFQTLLINPSIPVDRSSPSAIVICLIGPS